MQKPRVPEITQMSAVECGLACLAMVLTYHGRTTSISDLRAQSGLGRDGLSALSIVKIARNHNMRVRAISLQNTDFRSVPLPAIVHWEFNHFIVVERWSPKEVKVVDPAKGRLRLTSEEFDQGFTGVAITMEPGVHFDQNVVTQQLSLREYLTLYARQTPAILLEILGISLLLQGFGLILPLLTRFILDQVLPLKMNNMMGILAIGILLLVITQTVAILLREWLLVYLRARIDMRMMLDFFERLLTLPYAFFQARSSGDLLTRMSSNTVIRDTLSNQLITTLLDGCTVIIYFFILIWQSPPFAFLALGLGILQIILLLMTGS
jgi:ABC-type bacteriocin/lantibiotic exporter with double-glycine peptidase domain